MNWNNTWNDWGKPAQSSGWGTPPVIPNPQPTNPWDALDRDQLLMLWDDKKKAIEYAKNEELELRKYIVDRAFPEKHEGMNTLDLGNGYQLKAGVKFNYKLSDNETVEKCLDEIAKIGNEGAFIAERLVSWTPSFLLTEYRVLQEEVTKGNETAKQILDKVSTMLTIADAAPELKIKEPREKKK